MIEDLLGKITRQSQVISELRQKLYLQLEGADGSGAPTMGHSSSVANIVASRAEQASPRRLHFSISKFQALARGFMTRKHVNIKKSKLHPYDEGVLQAMRGTFQGEFIELKYREMWACLCTDKGKSFPHKLTI